MQNLAQQGRKRSYKYTEGLRILIEGASSIGVGNVRRTSSAVAVDTGTVYSRLFLDGSSPAFRHGEYVKAMFN